MFQCARSHSAIVAQVLHVPFYEWPPRRGPFARPEAALKLEPMKQHLPIAAHRQKTAATHVLSEKPPYLVFKNGGEIFARLLKPARGLTEPTLIGFNGRISITTFANIPGEVSANGCKIGGQLSLD